MGVDLLFVSQSPIHVTKRERKAYAFDFGELLGEGESVASCHQARLVPQSTPTTEVANALIGDPDVASPEITVEVDWSVAEIAMGRNYLLRVCAVIGTRREELACRFTVESF